MFHALWTLCLLMLLVAGCGTSEFSGQADQAGPKGKRTRPDSDSGRDSRDDDADDDGDGDGQGDGDEGSDGQNDAVEHVFFVAGFDVIAVDLRGVGDNITPLKARA